MIPVELSGCESKEEKTAGGRLRLTAETHPLSVAYEVSCRVRAERAAPPSLEDCTPKKVGPPFPLPWRGFGLRYVTSLAVAHRLVQTVDVTNSLTLVSSARRFGSYLGIAFDGRRTAPEE